MPIPSPALRQSVATGAARRAFAPWRDPEAVPLVRFDRVAKRFGATAAVEDLSLAVYEGEFFCLLGPSGCGKTTLMRMLGGFERPDSGRVTLAGQDLAGVPPHRRPVNMMFQSHALFPHMSVAGNVAFGLKQERMGRTEIAGRVAEMLRLVQLEGLDDRYPDQLSGGQRQRVALARALAKRPKVLLLDEPLSALDKRLREETRFELMDLQARLGTTFLMVTHDQDEAMAMADRIGVMDKGSIVQVGTPGEIYEEPKTRFVAQFVGDVNLVEGRIAGRENGCVAVATDAAPTPLAVEGSGDGLETGRSIAVAVRPEKMRIARSPPERGRNVLSGEVWDVGYLGDWTVYRVKLESGAIWRVSQANASRFVDDPIGREETVYVSFAPEAGVILAR